MDDLVLLSYLSPICGFVYVLLNYSELSSYPKLLLMHVPKIKNIGYIYKYTLYKTTKSQTVEHFYQTAQSAWCTVKSATISDLI